MIKNDAVPISWRIRLANVASGLGSMWRWLAAASHHLAPVQNTYSQHGEDNELWEEWRRLRPVAATGIYVDIGASHPSRLSNTYLFYRRGWTGLTVEPNLELMRLHKRFRSRDRQLCAACGTEPAVLPLRVAAAPVLSTLEEAQAVRGVRIVRTDYVPILPLDTIVDAMSFAEIDILSVDAEGWDLRVLQGGREVLEKTLLLIVEANSEPEAAAIQSELSSRFRFIRGVGCNLLFERRRTAN